jgi:hypothetical protein
MPKRGVTPGTQGVAIAGAGILSDKIGPFAAVAIGGGRATTVVLLTMLVWGRARPRRDSEDEQQQATR